jgi:hypothetical protein
LKADDDERIRQLEHQQDSRGASDERTAGDVGPDSIELARLCDLTGGDTDVGYSVERQLRHPPVVPEARWLGHHRQGALGAPGSVEAWGLVPDVAATWRVQQQLVKRWMQRRRLEVRQSSQRAIITAFADSDAQANYAKAVDSLGGTRVNGKLWTVAFDGQVAGAAAQKRLGGTLK